MSKDKIYKYYNIEDYMKLMPIGIQTFSKIIDNDYFYVDKTEKILNLINNYNYVFLSRPRRFGKSLLVTTLEQIYKGNKEIFKDLYIYDKYEFVKYPVIKINFSLNENKDGDDFKKTISNSIKTIYLKEKIIMEKTDAITQFSDLIIKLHDKYNKKVVILIDEYDKPILDNIEKEDLSNIKSSMAAFYSTIKALDEYIKFVFITGISKFSKVSVFSGMNNLKDISEDSKYSELLGFTQEEIEKYFAEGLEDYVKEKKISKDELIEKIKKWYNGYAFTKEIKRVYNPYSVLNFFSDKEFKNYWFSTGTPSFLIKLLQNREENLEELLKQKQNKDMVFYYKDFNKMPLNQIFFQTGYFTIKDFKNDEYSFQFPNYEVKESFLIALVDAYGYTNKGNEKTLIYEMKKYFENNDIESIIDRLKIFYSSIPYTISIKSEKYYQTLFYAIFEILGYEIDVEIATNIGRIDVLVKTNTHIYIIEIKLDGTAKSAIEQIKEKQYPNKYLKDKKRKILIGIEFNTQNRNIREYIVEEF